MPTLTVTSPMPVPRQALFAWHERPGAFDRLLPPWVRAELLESSGGIRDGARLRFRIRRGPFALTWDARHSHYHEGHAFTDTMASGPFRSWSHTHRTLDAKDPASSILRDEVTFSLPGGSLAWHAAAPILRPDLTRMFTFRHLRTRADLALLSTLDRALNRPARIGVSGVGGVIGGALASLLRAGGHDVLRLVRRRANPGESTLAVGAGHGQVDREPLERLDAIVHLGGEPIASGRWTAAKRDAVRASRVESTRALAGVIASLAHPPRVLVVASGIGLYGDRGEDELTEDAGIGSGFFAEVARDWEAAAEPARAAGVRVVHLRLGVVLSRTGGALGATRRLFALGLGVVPGSGRQWWSWIGLDDALGVILHAIATPDLAGAVNAVAPAPTRARDFARTLARVLDRPLAARLPAWALRLLAGERGDTILWSTRCVPAKLRATGYRFLEPDLDGALRRELALADPAAHAIDIAWS
jgi:uncharacterized protein (TIGR01777 family)